MPIEGLDVFSCKKKKTLCHFMKLNTKLVKSHHFLNFHFPLQKKHETNRPRASMSYRLIRMCLQLAEFVLTEYTVNNTNK